MYDHEIYVTMDSFGDYCPANWDEIADYLNEKIEHVLDKYDHNVYPECWDEIQQIWVDYCEGKFDDAPQMAEVDINGIPYDQF